MQVRKRNSVRLQDKWNQIGIIAGQVRDHLHIRRVRRYMGGRMEGVLILDGVKVRMARDRSGFWESLTRF